MALRLSLKQGRIQVTLGRGNKFLKYRKCKIALLIIFLVFLTGCPKRYVLVFFNNTGSDWAIQFKNGRADWKGKTQIYLQDYGSKVSVGNLEWIARDGGTTPILTLKKKGALLKYDIFNCGITDDLNQYSSEHGKYITKFQLETDENIYIVHPGSSFPTQDIQSQPICFPIRTFNK